MATASQIEERIKTLTAPGFRNRLLDRGLARELIWAEGDVPEGAPPFSTELSADLVDHGFTLLRLALELRSQNAEARILERAFLVAAEAIEATVRNGDSNQRSRGFHLVIAAAAYHLGHYSARAYCLLGNDLEQLNLNPAEKIVALLMRRELKRLEQDSWSFLINRGRFDDGLSAALGEQSLESDDALQIILNDSIIKAVNIFFYALEVGADAATAGATDLLNRVIDASAACGIVTLWWLSFVTRHLIDDLWRHSLHVLIPPTLNGNHAWPELREHFIDVLWSRDVAEVELWPSQVEAAKRVQDAKDDLVAALPTGAGKTRIAELAILRTLAENKRVVYVTPLRALSAQIETHLRRTFQPLMFSVSSLYGAIGSTELDLDSLKNRHVVVSTPEKLDFALRNDPTLIDDVGLIVLDEGHMIGEGEREVRYEVLVQRILRRPDADERRLVCLSAVFPEGEQLKEFVSWLRGDAPGEPISSKWRPSRQRFGTIVQNGKYARLDLHVETERPFNPYFLEQRKPRPPSRRKKLFPSDDAELVLASAWEFARLNQGVLIFCPQRRSVAGLAGLVLELYRHSLLDSLLDPEASVEEAVEIGTEWLGADHPAIACLRLGVAVHHAKLPRQFLQALEGLLATKVLKVVIASPTLAQGLNLSAATVIMRSIFRTKEVIKPEEFANVAGRAGRAFVDIDGQILYPIFEQEKRQYKLERWSKLVDTSQERNLTSGILRLVILLFQRLVTRAPSKDKESLIEYIFNVAAWESLMTPEEGGEEKDDDAPNQYEDQLRSLDAAILSLLDDLECPENELAAALDDALKNSLWSRHLKKLSPDIQEVMNAILVSRTKQIWQQTSATQRRGFYFAGIGLHAGLAIDAQLDTLLTLLTEAEHALTSGETDLLCDRAQEFAKIMFQIAPFAPIAIPVLWPDTIRGWLMGIPVADIETGDDTDINDFIQDGLCYKLTWAVEAVRARSSAESSGLQLGGRIAAALEVGSIVPEEILLLRAGLRSRTAAREVVNALAPSFSTFTSMRKWLLSEEVLATTSNSNWPSAATSAEWKRFLNSYSRPEHLKWVQQTIQYGAVWDQGTKPKREREPVRLYTGVDGSTTVLREDLVPIGKLTVLYHRPKGPQVCVIGSDLTSVAVTTFSPKPS